MLFKKLLLEQVIILLLVLISLTGCGGNNSNDDDQQSFVDKITGPSSDPANSGTGGGGTDPVVILPPVNPTYKELLKYPGDYSATPILVTWRGRVYRANNISSIVINKIGSPHQTDTYIKLSRSPQKQLTLGDKIEFTAEITKVLNVPLTISTTSIKTMNGRMIWHKIIRSF